jgi:hypothetical protein
VCDSVCVCVSSRVSVCVRVRFARTRAQARTVLQRLQTFARTLPICEPCCVPCFLRSHLPYQHVRELDPRVRYRPETWKPPSPSHQRCVCSGNP